LHEVDLRRLSADLPQDNLKYSFVVAHLQRQRRPGNTALPISSQPTCVDKDRNKINFQRSSAADSLTLRPYCKELTLAFRSHQDIQSSDGHGLLLQYVSSDVTKTCDDSIAQSLYDADLDARNAAFRFVVNHKPAEPEMWFHISNFKSCYHSVLTKKLCVPRFCDAEENKHVLQYSDRPEAANHLTLLQFQRQYVTSGSEVHPYPHGKHASVGCKYVSIHNSEFMFQHTLMNISFRDVTELFPPHFLDVLEVLQSYAVAEYRNSALWHDDALLTDMLRRRGLKNHKITTYLSFVHALRDTYHLWCHANISSDNLNIAGFQDHFPFDLNNMQSQFLLAVSSRIEKETTVSNISRLHETEGKPIFLATGKLYKFVKLTVTNAQELNV